MRAMRPLRGPVYAVLGLVCCSLVGCAAPGGREVTITAQPDDATIYVDGQERGQGHVTERFNFDGEVAFHTISARRKGYQEEQARVEASDPRERVALVLRP